MNEKIRTVIVDDSAIARGIIEKSLKNDGGFEIVAMLSNGRRLFRGFLHPFPFF